MYMRLDEQEMTSVVEGNVQALEGGMELEHRAQRQHSCVGDQWGYG
jgi:hypothetical protein